MSTYDFKIFSNTYWNSRMFPIPILFGWLIGSCIQYGCQPNPDQTIEIIQSTSIGRLPILSLIIGMLSLYFLIYMLHKSNRDYLYLILIPHISKNLFIYEWYTYV